MQSSQSNQSNLITKIGSNSFLTNGYRINYDGHNLKVIGNGQIKNTPVSSNSTQFISSLNGKLNVSSTSDSNSFAKIILNSGILSVVSPTDTSSTSDTSSSTIPDQLSSLISSQLGSGLSAQGNSQLSSLINSQLGNNHGQPSSLISGQLGQTSQDSSQLTQGQLSSLLSGQLGQLTQGQLSSLLSGQLGQGQSSQGSSQLTQSQLSSLLSGKLSQGQLSSLLSSHLGQGQSSQGSGQLTQGSGQLSSLLSSQLGQLTQGQLSSLLSGQLTQEQLSSLLSGQLTQGQSNQGSGQSSQGSNQLSSLLSSQLGQLTQGQLSNLLSGQLTQGQLSSLLSGKLSQGQLSSLLSSHLGQGQSTQDSSQSTQGQLSSLLSSHLGQGSDSSDVSSSKFHLAPMISSITSELEKIKNTLPLNSFLSIDKNVENILSSMSLANFKATKNPTIYSGLQWVIYGVYYNENLSLLSTPLSSSNISSWTSAVKLTNDVYSGCSYNLLNYVGGTTSTNTSAINALTDNGGQGPFTVVWYGYFMPNVSGAWTFQTTSDDGSYLWVNSDSATPITDFDSFSTTNLLACGITLTNSLVNNGQPHAITTKSASSSFTAGQLYPIVILGGQNSGGYTCSVSVTDPNNTSYSNNCAYIFGNYISN